MARRCESCKEIFALLKRKGKEAEDQAFEKISAHPTLAHYEEDNNGTHLCVDSYYCKACKNFYERHFCSDERYSIPFKQVKSMPARSVEDALNRLAKFLVLEDRLKHLLHSRDWKSAESVTVYNLVNGNRKSWANGVSKMDEIQKNGVNLSKKSPELLELFLSLEDLFEENGFGEHAAAGMQIIKFNVPAKSLKMWVRSGYCNPCLDIRTKAKSTPENIEVVYPIEDLPAVKLSEWQHGVRENPKAFHQSFHAKKAEVLKQTKLEQQIADVRKTLLIKAEPEWEPSPELVAEMQRIFAESKKEESQKESYNV